jgi:hypothetical protein
MTIDFYTSVSQPRLQSKPCNRILTFGNCHYQSIDRSLEVAFSKKVAKNMSRVSKNVTSAFQMNDQNFTKLKHRRSNNEIYDNIDSKKNLILFH